VASLPTRAQDLIELSIIAPHVLGSTSSLPPDRHAATRAPGSPAAKTQAAEFDPVRPIDEYPLAHVREVYLASHIVGVIQAQHW
jgi:hypothetical protein